MANICCSGAYVMLDCEKKKQSRTEVEEMVKELKHLNNLLVTLANLKAASLENQGYRNDLEKDKTVPRLFRDYSSSTLDPNFRPQPRKSRTAGKQFMLGHFHLWPLFIQSPSNHSSLHLKADSTHAYDASR